MSAPSLRPVPDLETSTPWLTIEAPPLPRRVGKRLLDIVGATLALVLISPLLALAAIAIRLTSKGPVVFSQARVGQFEQPFVIYKLRTMTIDNDDSAHRAYAVRLLTDTDAPAADEEGTYKLTNDPRVTRVGAFLRRYSIDELPQLVNVLRGEMSLVGPRPALDWEVEHYSSQHRRRAAVRPGCTGLWQVSGRSKMTTLEMLDLDVTYAESWTVNGDVSILGRTPVVLLRGDGAR